MPDRANSLSGAFFLDRRAQRRDELRIITEKMVLVMLRNALHDILQHIQGSFREWQY